jgi:riboflavin transporter
MKFKTKETTKLLVRIGMLSALAFIIMLFEFYIGFAEYLKLDFSDLIAMVGGITMGPLAGIAIQFIKNLLKVVFFTKTAGIGELANVIVGIAFILPTSLVYQRIKSNKGLIIGLITGSITMVIVALFANYFVLLPMYWGFISQESLTSASKLAYILAVTLPFNVIKVIIVSILTMIVHVSLKPIYKYLM